LRRALDDPGRYLESALSGPVEGLVVTA